MEPGALKSELLLEDTGHNICCFVLYSTYFPSIWSSLFDVNQLFSQKWSPKLSKANFCSKTVGTVFAVFVLHSTSFSINLIIIVWRQTIIFSEMEPEGLKSKLLLEDSGHSICCFLFFFQHLSQSIWLLLFVVNQFDYYLLSINFFSKKESETLKSELLLKHSGHSICCFCSSLNIFSDQFDHYCLLSINYFIRIEARRSQKQTFARRQWAQHLLFFFLLPTSFPINLIIIVCCQSIFSQKWSPKFSKAKFCSKTVSTIFAVFFLISTSQEIVVSASLMVQLNVGFLLTNTSKPVVGWVILSCKSQVFSIISEFEHHFQESSLFVNQRFWGNQYLKVLNSWWRRNVTKKKIHLLIRYLSEEQLLSFHFFFVKSNGFQI